MPKSLNETIEAVSEADLLLIEELAGYFFTPRKIALMVEMDAEQAVYLMGTEGNQVYNAFQKGRLQNEVNLRRSIIQLAKAGSSPAQTMAMDMFNKSKAEMLDR